MEDLADEPAPILDHVVEAPLKHGLVDGPVPSISTILDHVVEAPLKPHLLGRRLRPGADHPRPRGRGPVEAWTIPAALVTSPAILDHVVEAPLKRGWQRRDGGAVPAHPRPRGRGPVEAPP